MAGEQTFGALVEAAHGLDRDWMEVASCRLWAERQREREIKEGRPPGPTPWHVGCTPELHNGVPGTKMVDMALLICAGCVVAYDCARYAVNGRMAAGTWGMKIKLLQWLQSQPDAIDIINAAEIAGCEVEAYVADERAMRS